MPTGSFITVEGGEGCGKSTQIALLERAFINARLTCLRTREPGGTPAAEEIRALLVTGEPGKWDPVSETLLFLAARVHHVTQLIQPALAAGNHVICDRYVDSTRVYQGIGKGLGIEYIDTLHLAALKNYLPSLTLILDIDPKAGLERAHARRGAETRFENMEFSFHEKVRKGFLDIAGKESNRCVVVDAKREVAAVHVDIINLVNQRLGLSLSPAQ